MKKENLNTENAKKEIHNALRTYRNSVGAYGRGSEVAKSDRDKLILSLDRALISGYIPIPIYDAGYDYLMSLEGYGETHPKTVDSVYYFENLLIH